MRMRHDWSLMYPVQFVHLFLLAVVGAQSAADYYISGLPGLSWPDNSLKMHSGHIVLDANHHGEMFFWHVQQKHLADRQRTVIWLNGGPGCSSMDGLFLEIGPFRLQDDHTLVENEGSWHEFANLLFVDQPLGTGFSFVDSDRSITELDQMADQMMDFLDKFIDLFPEYADDDVTFYLGGESYAGQYIPYLGKAMLDRQSNTSGAKKYDVKGLLIGNGWIDPMAGYFSYLPFAVDYGIIQKDSEQYRAVSTVVQECSQSVALYGSQIHVAACEGILSKIFDVTLEQDSGGVNRCINGYDLRLRDSYPDCGMNWPTELKYMTPYLQRRDVLEAIHATDKVLGWSECNGHVSSTFRARNSLPSSELLPDLLQKLSVLLYSGDTDIICNHLSTETMLSDMAWNGAQGFATASQVPWTFMGEDAGFYQSARNLTYVLYNNASHMVPYDQALRTRDMLNRFMGVDLADVGGKSSESTIGGKKPETPTSFDEASDLAEEELKEQTSLAERYRRYYKAGTVALIVVVIAVCGLVWFIWKHKGSIRRRYGFDKLGLQEAGRADETELEELTVQTPLFDTDTFDIGSDDDIHPSDTSPTPSRPMTPASGSLQGSSHKLDKPKSGSRRHND